MNILLALDLLGTFAFASYGAYLAIRKEYDIFGIFVIGFVTAVGGGTLREIMIGRLPTYFADYNYVIAILLGVLVAVSLSKQFSTLRPALQTLDAVGLVTFAYIGASVAVEYNLNGFGVIAMAVVSAAGGGVIRDIMLNVKPEVLYQDIYASVAALVGLAVWLIESPSTLTIYAIILLALGIRLAAVYFKLSLWRPAIQP